jgi:hypothetical protein
MREADHDRGDELQQWAEYRQRTIANVVAAALVTFLMISGYWIVGTLAG